MVVTIGTISPNSVPVGFAGPMTLTGSGFLPGATVVFENGTLGPPPEVTDLVVVDDGRIQFTLTVKTGGPKRERTWDVRVTNPDGSTAVVVAGLQITP